MVANPIKQVLVSLLDVKNRYVLWRLISRTVIITFRLFSINASFTSKVIERIRVPLRRTFPPTRTPLAVKSHISLDMCRYVVLSGRHHLSPDRTQSVVVNRP